jgi:glycosyltransferase involved in cell wall biosynthesis
MRIMNAMFSKVNGGLEQVFLNYTPVLQNQGNQVISVIHPKAKIKDSCPKANLVLVNNYNQYDPLAILRLRKLIRAEAPQCIITHSYRAAYLFKKTQTKVPRIAVCHVEQHYDFGATALIALTEHMRQNIIKSGKPANTVFTVPNMIDIPDDACYQVPHETECPVIGVCARLVSIKGIDIFIEALAELKRRKIPFKAKIAGDGVEHQQFVKLIQHHQLSHDIELLGWVHDTQQFYKSIDVLCLPSRAESFGMVILEGMIHSLPMVLSDLPGPRDIVGTTESAILVPPADALRLADGLERIIYDRTLAKELAFNAFNRVQHYSSHNVGPVLQEAVRKACGQPG